MRRRPGSRSRRRCLTVPCTCLRQQHGQYPSPLRHLHRDSYPCPQLPPTSNATQLVRMPLLRVHLYLLSNAGPPQECKRTKPGQLQAEISHAGDSMLPQLTASTLPRQLRAPADAPSYHYGEASLKPASAQRPLVRGHTHIHTHIPARGYTRT